MKHLNPYAPPQSQDLSAAPYTRFVRCSHAATLCGVACAILITLATHSLLYGCAVVCASLMLHFFLAALIAWLTETLGWPEREAMDHRKMVMPEPRQAHTDRFSNAGYALPQILGFIAGLLVTLLFIPSVYAILVAVMGMQEPRW